MMREGEIRREGKFHAFYKDRNGFPKITGLFPWTDPTLGHEHGQRRVGFCSQENTMADVEEKSRRPEGIFVCDCLILL